MSEDQELLARIGQLAGHINLHKAHSPGSQPPAPGQASYGAPGSHSLRGSATSRPRSTLYRTYQGRGRGASRSYSRNHSLVLNNKPAQSPASQLLDSPARTGGTDPLQPAAAYVTKRGRHKQLINASVLDKVTLQRKQAIDESQQHKLLDIDRWERQRMHQFLKALDTLPTTSESTHKIEIDSLKFEILMGGSKLARIHDSSDVTRPTPKRTIVHGVTFVRSKQGNLYRSGIVRASNNRHLFECPDYANTGACRKKRCGLPHVDRAGQIRRQTVQSADPESATDSRVTLEANESDLSSDEDDHPGMDGEDIDSEELDDEFIEGVDESGRLALAEQKDFVGF
ncbi:MAG: hypothetical protein Q9218_001986 [Villophora microphyllina]